MNKLYALFTLLALNVSVAIATPICTIDTTNTLFFSPAPDSLPCIEVGVAFNQVVQIHVPKTFDVGPFVGLPAGLVILTVDSMRIDSLSGLPTGLTYGLNPADGFFLGGDNGCALVNGTTNDPTGHYPLTTNGTISVSGIPGGFGFPPDTSFDLATVQAQSGMFQLAVDVINPGDPCHPALGITNFNAALNSLMQVYPNPSNGAFELKLNTGGRVTGELVIMDMTGRKVFVQALDIMGNYGTTINLGNQPKGLYTLQLRSTEGFASKNISIE